MRINPVNLSNNNKIEKKLTKTNFTGRRQLYYIKKPDLLNIECKKVYEKASDLLNKLPSSKMEATYICKVGDKNFGIRWNTQNSNNLILKIKDNINSNDNTEWGKSKIGQSVIECIFDNKGIMRSGTITKKIKESYSINAFYNRENNNVHRTLVIDGLIYHPYPDTYEYWTSMPQKSSYGIKKDINLKNYLEEIELAELFYKLIDKNTTIK